MKVIQVKKANDIDSVVSILLTLFQNNGDQEVVIKDRDDDRSSQQNRLAFLWYKHIAGDKGDMTVEDVRAYCKLVIGIPIRRENEEFRLVYDEHIRPLSYESKIACMIAPIDFPTTRDMGVKEMSRYLSEMEKHFAEQAIILPRPGDLYFSSMGVKNESTKEKEARKR